MKTRKEEYIDKTAKQLREWSETIDELEGRASRTAAGIQAGFENRMRDLKEKRNLLSGRLRELKDSGGNAWTALKTGVETARKDLRDAFVAARDEFRKAA